jgi:hypothetical protein
MAFVVVAGEVLRRPTGENLASHLHYLIGLRRLGHQVVYLEERSSEPGEPGEHGSETATVVPRPGLVLLRDLLRRCRVEVPVVWVDSDAGLVGGMVWPQLRRRLSKADLLIDLGGHCWLPERRLARRRALVDLDGRFEESAAGRQTDHDLRFSYRPDGALSADSEWLTTLPPVVPRLWYGPKARSGMSFHALAGGAWARRDADGRAFTSALRLAGLLDLPERVPARFEIGARVDGEPARGLLREAGWGIPTPGETDASLSAYRAQVIGSQGAVVVPDPAPGRFEGGWLDARTACFLAAGRPLVVSNGELWDWSAARAGVVGFEQGGAAEAVERVRGRLEAHSMAARELAERFLHFRVVLPRLLERALPSRLEAVA